MADQLDRLTACGELLFGSAWREKLPKLLNTDQRLFRRYLAETVVMTPAKWALLIEPLRNRAADADRYLAQVTEMAAAPPPQPTTRLPRSASASGDEAPSPGGPVRP
ncbi:hypothetical protein [Elstera cyanobacteriorum]|uniref:hypothetical protein n=1 Tax=Elstera cyanobacteriorum TaxID=2022747 RepID=UPI0023F224E6|nr:hypothetical protein [Elstera cyanobacteriorum]